jgi:hypothetical protein
MASVVGPEGTRGISLFAAALGVSLAGLRQSGVEPDTIIVGSQDMANKVLLALQELDLDMHLILDPELQDHRYWLTSSNSLDKLAGRVDN